MRDVARVFREYARLDLRRQDRGLSIRELERWSALKHRLDGEFRRGGEGPDPRRSSRRVETRLNCTYASGDALAAAVITNLATAGVFIRTKSPLPIGSRLQLRICLADTGAEIEVRGVVVSNNVGPRFEHGARGMGVRFTRVSQQELEQIGALYAHELAGASQQEGQAGAPCEIPVAGASTGSNPAVRQLATACQEDPVSRGRPRPPRSGS